ncbi:MAG: ribonuclease E activity regulator RraA [Fluviibacter sp.]|jgi:regulator of ribonuclease activity A
MTSLLTTDLLDNNEALIQQEQLRIVAPMFQRYGGKTAFAGQIVTLKLFEDNSLVRAVLGEPGTGKVLVIDGGGSMRCALLGDQLAEMAVKNGWEGVVVYGCIRDSAAINGLPLGVRALNTHPLKTVKKNIGERDVNVTFGGVTLKPGEWLCADEDGVIVSTTSLA